MKRFTASALAASALLTGYCVLSFFQTSSAAPPIVKEPFANPTELRIEMVDELKTINAQLKEQNALLREQIALLRSGGMRVVVTLPEGAK
jgi:hypothetical protein